jgi:hypothetical protein
MSAVRMGKKQQVPRFGRDHTSGVESDIPTLTELPSLYLP